MSTFQGLQLPPPEGSAFQTPLRLRRFTPDLFRMPEWSGPDDGRMNQPTRGPQFFFGLA